MTHIQIVIIVVIIFIAIILIALNQDVLGFNNKSNISNKSQPSTNTMSQSSITTSKGIISCPYNSESEKDNAEKPFSVPDELRKLNNVNVKFDNSPYTMKDVFGINGAKSQLITETRYSQNTLNTEYPPDTADDYVPKHVLDSLVTPEDLRYGNPDVDGYSLCDVNPSDESDYYDPKLMHAKLKSSSDPVMLSTCDTIDPVGEVIDMSRGSDNPLPGPFSGRYKKCD